MHNINHLRSAAGKGSFSLEEKLRGDPAQGEVTTVQLGEIKKKLTWAFIFVNKVVGSQSNAMEKVGMKVLAPTTSFVP